MVHVMRVSGMKIQTREMAEVIRYGQMVLYTKVIGRMIRQTEEGDWKDDKAHGFGRYIHTDGA